MSFYQKINAYHIIFAMRSLPGQKIAYFNCDDREDFAIMDHEGEVGAGFRGNPMMNEPMLIELINNVIHNEGYMIIKQWIPDPQVELAGSIGKLCLNDWEAVYGLILSHGGCETMPAEIVEKGCVNNGNVLYKDFGHVLEACFPGARPGGLTP